MRCKFEAEKNQLLAEIESERSHHQRILKDHNRLQQRYENLQDEVSPQVKPCGLPSALASGMVSQYIRVLSLLIFFYSVQNGENDPSIKLTKTKQEDALIAELKQRIMELEMNPEQTNHISTIQPAIEISPSRTDNELQTE